jgi:UDP-2,3-diacylglucosamine pyrophosphatase LpxH
MVYEDTVSAVVISDLHLESVHTLSEQIGIFIGNLLKDYDLILNGDIIDSSYPNVPWKNLQILELIRQESFRRKIVWIRGNHDDCSLLRDRGKIHFKRYHSIGSRLIITHGNELDKTKARIQQLLSPFKLIQVILVKSGLKPINVVQFASKFRPFYRLYRKKLMLDATKFAKKNGFEAIACGHTHYPEDRNVQGVRYINTGAWTEYPPHYLMVNEQELSLKKIDAQTNTVLSR